MSRTLLVALIFLVLIIVEFSENGVKKPSDRANRKTYRYTTWYQCLNGDSSDKLFHKVLKDNNLKRVNNKRWDLFFPCKSDYSERGLLKIKTNNPNQIVSYISGNNILGSKEYLSWALLKDLEGKSVIPKSYILPKDRNNFLKDYSPDKMYILKSEAQRQTGLKLSRNKEEVLNSRGKGFKVVQEFLDNPLLFRGYKINFRIYLLVVCIDGKKEGYVYNDGIVSYAKDRYDHPVTFDNGVASFYTSKGLYDRGFPITFNELKKNLDLDWGYLYGQFKIQIVKVLKATKKRLCSKELPLNNKTFQLFGVDFMVQDNSGKLKPFILEINMGPGMKPYNHCDKKMRELLINDILSVTGIVKNKNKGFERVL